MGSTATAPIRACRRLAAQRADYLEKVLQAYRTGERKSTQMAAMSGA